MHQTKKTMICILEWIPSRLNTKNRLSWNISACALIGRDRAQVNSEITLECSEKSVESRNLSIWSAFYSAHFSKTWPWDLQLQNVSASSAIFTHIRIGTNVCDILESVQNLKRLLQTFFTIIRVSYCSKRKITGFFLQFLFNQRLSTISSLHQGFLNLQLNLQ